MIVAVAALVLVVIEQTNEFATHVLLNEFATHVLLNQGGREGQGRGKGNGRGKGKGKRKRGEEGSRRGRERWGRTRGEGGRQEKKTIYTNSRSTAPAAVTGIRDNTNIKDIEHYKDIKDTIPS